MFNEFIPVEIVLRMGGKERRENEGEGKSN
jgi:hypothetical protein